MDETQRMWEERWAAGTHPPDGTAPHPEVTALLDRLAGRHGAPGAHRAPEDPRPTALDLGTGSGRHALALARAGWDVTAVDYSPSAVRTVGEALRAEGLPGRALVADLRAWTPGTPQHAGESTGTGTVPAHADLVVAAYFHHDLTLLRRAAEWLAPGGHLLWITHAPGSVDGPPPAVPRPDVHETLAVLEGKDLDLLRAEQVRTSPTALDVVVEALRPL
ncbi:hypothetical protein AUQ48_03440 [Kocuria flava]|uniref:Methyltransferase domain-containing protein n=1 Tax=Kocuria flava TaxID=446860 RepID=A0A2N4SZR7_9MICC|nr:class I SAM-dependent methyltransferase [Kocuria flava]PLC11474.1 hypothetical protein AUQ48_03440 [Kocuria flava]